MHNLYQTLLLLYPAEHRAMLGEEMDAVFGELRADVLRKKRILRTGFWIREITGLLSGALAAHLRMTAPDGAFAFPWRFSMRNGFRFPKSTIVFMAMILGGILIAIKKGQDIASSVPDVNPPLAVHIQPTHSILLGGMPLFFAFFYAAGLIGWAILFAMRRSGVHRLDQIAGQKQFGNTNH